MAFPFPVLNRLLQNPGHHNNSHQLQNASKDLLQTTYPSGSNMTDMGSPDDYHAVVVKQEPLSEEEVERETSIDGEDAGRTVSYSYIYNSGIAGNNTLDNNADAEEEFHVPVFFATDQPIKTEYYEDEYINTDVEYSMIKEPPRGNLPPKTIASGKRPFVYMDVATETDLLAENQCKRTKIGMGKLPKSRCLKRKINTENEKRTKSKKAKPASRGRKAGHRKGQKSRGRSKKENPPSDKWKRSQRNRNVRRNKGINIGHKTERDKPDPLMSSTRRRQVREGDGPQGASDEDGALETEGRRRTPRISYKENETENYICHICSKEITGARNFQRHKKHHEKSKTEKRIKCSLCSTAFLSTEIYEGHMRIHRGEVPFPCKICGKGFTLMSHLRSHMKSHTGEKRYRIENETEKFICDICSKEITGARRFQRHKKHHEKPKRAKRIKCNLCSMVFLSKEIYEGHMRTHRGEVAFTCTLCEKGFRLMSHLRSHMKSHTGEKPYTCEICGKSFVDACRRVRHLKSHIARGELVMNGLTEPAPGAILTIAAGEGESVVSVKNGTPVLYRPYKCSICCKAFTRTAFMINHIRDHKSGKLFEIVGGGQQFDQSEYISKLVDVCLTRGRPQKDDEMACLDPDKSNIDGNTECGPTNSVSTNALKKTEQSDAIQPSDVPQDPDDPESSSMNKINEESKVHGPKEEQSDIQPSDAPKDSDSAVMNIDYEGCKVKDEEYPTQNKEQSGVIQQDALKDPESSSMSIDVGCKIHEPKEKEQSDIIEPSDVPKDHESSSMSIDYERSKVDEPKEKEQSNVNQSSHILKDPECSAMNTVGEECKTLDTSGLIQEDKKYHGNNSGIRDEAVIEEQCNSKENVTDGFKCEPTENDISSRGGELQENIQTDEKDSSKHPYITSVNLIKMESTDLMTGKLGQDDPASHIQNNHSSTANADTGNRPIEAPDLVNRFANVDKKEFPYQCAYCDELFADPRIIEAHVLFHTTKREDKEEKVRDHICEYCGKSFYKRGHLKAHVMMHTGERPYICEACGKGFTESSKLTRHLKTHFKSTVTPPSNHGNMSSTNAGSFVLLRDLLPKANCTRERKRHFCEYCDKSFSKKSYLTSHIMQHTDKNLSDLIRKSNKEKERKKHTCEYCGKSYSKSKYLAGHVMQHKGEMPYSCESCGKGFCEMRSLARHLKTHERKEDEWISGASSSEEENAVEESDDSFPWEEDTEEEGNEDKSCGEEDEFAQSSVSHGENDQEADGDGDDLLSDDDDLMSGGDDDDLLSGNDDDEDDGTVEKLTEKHTKQKTGLIKDEHVDDEVDDVDDDEEEEADDGDDDLLSGNDDDDEDDGTVEKLTEKHTKQKTGLIKDEHVDDEVDDVDDGVDDVEEEADFLNNDDHDCTEESKEKVQPKRKIGEMMDEDVDDDKDDFLDDDKSEEKQPNRKTGKSKSDNVEDVDEEVEWSDVLADGDDEDSNEFVPFSGFKACSSKQNNDEADDESSDAESENLENESADDDEDSLE